MDLKDLTKNLSKLDKDDLLDALGLQTRKSSADYLVPGLLLFGAGVAVGCGIGLMLAPKTGKELRDQLTQAIGKGIEQGRGQLDQAKEKLATARNGSGVTSNT